MSEGGSPHTPFQDVGSAPDLKKDEDRSKGLLCCDTMLTMDLPHSRIASDDGRNQWTTE